MVQEMNVNRLEPEDVLTPGQLAKRLQVGVNWVYRHSDELGVYRLGKYLRFSLLRVRERLEKGAIGCSAVGSPTQRPAPTNTKKDKSDGRGTE
jgi:hypothetical protein